MTTDTPTRNPDVQSLTLTEFMRRMPWGTHIDLGRYEHPHQGCWASGIVRYEEDGPPIFRFHITDANRLTRATVEDGAVYADVRRYEPLLAAIFDAEASHD